MPQSALVNKRDSLTRELQMLKHGRPNPARVRYIETRLQQLNKEIGAIFTEADVKRNDFNYHDDKRKVGEQYLVPNAAMWSGQDVGYGKAQEDRNGDKVGSDGLTNTQRVTKARLEAQRRYDETYGTKK